MEIEEEISRLFEENGKGVFYKEEKKWLKR
jgi:hypothetical protein